MISNDVAKTLWCPFALVQSETQECNIVGAAFGELVAVAAINRSPTGEANADCLCITEKCVFWRKLDDSTGDCSKLDDNMNDRISDSDQQMEDQWCPHARPENEPIRGKLTGAINGCTVALSSANRIPGGNPHPGSLCLTGKCMAYSTNGAGEGFCMSADKNMQR